MVRFIQRLTLSLFCHHLVPYTDTRCGRPHSPKPLPFVRFSALSHTLRPPPYGRPLWMTPCRIDVANLRLVKRAAELQPRYCNQLG